MSSAYDFLTVLWKYPGAGAWYFLSLPKEFTEEIRTFTHGWQNKGFGTIKIEAVVNNVSWNTSIFPDKKSGTYMMPVKKDVRAKLGIREGDELKVSVKLIDI